MFHRETYLTLVLLTVSQRSLFASSPSTPRRQRVRFSESFLSVPTEKNISLPQADDSTMTTTLQNIHTGTSTVIDGNLYNQEPQRLSYLPPPELHRFLTTSGIKTYDWTQVGNDLDGDGRGNGSDYSVGMSADGKRAIVGAPGYDVNGIRAGYARIYEENNGLWTQVGDDLDGEAEGDYSGGSVGMSADGNRVIVGAPDNGGKNGAGHARIYEENDGIWTQVGNDLDGEAAGDRSGYSVGMSADGRRVIVGALGNGGNGYYAGHAKIYEENDGLWTQVGNDLDGEAAGDASGYSVGMSADGKRVIVGAIWNGENGIDAGHARIYEENDGIWTQVGNDLDGEAAFDESGWSVGMSADGKRVIVGAPGNGGNGDYAGHARIYEENDGIWTQVGKDLDGEDAGDASGLSVGMSADGKRVIVGAPWNGGKNGAGHARIYEENDGTWTQVGKDLDGEAADDGSGYSVGMSADGERVIVGAPGNAGGNGYYAGHAMIYAAYPSESSESSADVPFESSESSADVPFKFLSVIGPVVGVIFILF